MEDWIVYGIISALVITFADILRKYVTGSVDLSLVVFIPLLIAGIISFIYLCSTDKLSTLQKLQPNQLGFLGVLSVTTLLISYFVTKCLKASKNPGYGKTIITLNVIITTIISIYIFKTATFNKYAMLGVLLVIIGLGILVTNV